MRVSKFIPEKDRSLVTPAGHNVPAHVTGFAAQFPVCYSLKSQKNRCVRLEPLRKLVLAKMKFIKKIAKAVAEQYDPERESRINDLSRLLYVRLNKERRQFQLESFLETNPASKGDLTHACERVVERILDNVWDDEILTPKEYKTLEWVCDALQISREKMKSLVAERASSLLLRILPDIMVRGEFTNKDRAHVEHLAIVSGVNIKEFVTSFVWDEFFTYITTQFQKLDWHSPAGADDGWKRLLSEAAFFSYEKEQVVRLLSSNIRQVLSRNLQSLLDSQEVTEQDEIAFAQLLEVFDFMTIDYSFSIDLLSKLEDFKKFQELNKGRLPTVDTPYGINLKAGEIVHAIFPVQLSYSTPASEFSKDFWGDFICLDKRVIFQSSEKSFSISYTSIFKLELYQDGAVLQVLNKPRYFITFLGDDKDYDVAVFGAVVRQSRQNASEMSDTPKPSRHISKEVRARVWQAYGGRCVECGADDYLEFDHIIPHSKGGSNEENNIQLLCRRCNLQKSDSI